MLCGTITLTEAGIDTGNFSLYSDADLYTTPFETGLSQAELLLGYYSNSIPDSTTIIRIKSNTICENYTDMVRISPQNG